MERNEIAAHYLHNALDCLEELNGKRDREEIYNIQYSVNFVSKIMFHVKQ
jgi:hypothetical protein